MSTDCLFCPGTRTCKHLDPPRAQPSAPSDTPREQIVAPGPSSEAPKAGGSLFALADLRALRCVLCQTVILANGRGQANNRLVHGMQHVRDGTAVCITRGLPPGIMRFEVLR